MNSNQFSFKNLLQVSSITQNNQSTSKSTAQQHSYKQKYLQTKQSVKKFITMVEKQFQKLTMKHTEEKNLLTKEIQELKQQLKGAKASKDYDVNVNQNDVSSFTVRSRKSHVNTSEKSLNKGNRSMSQQTSNVAVGACFNEIQGFDDYSKIMSRTMKSITNSTKSQTLIQLQNSLNNQRKSSLSRVNQKNQQQNVFDNLTENDFSINSLALNENQGQLLGYRNKWVEKAKLKERQENVVSLTTIDKTSKGKQNNNQKQQSRNYNDQDSSYKCKSNLYNETRDNKQNYMNSSKEDQTKKAQENSVRNILKNLRNNMQVKIQKESKLQASPLRQ